MKMSLEVTLSGVDHEVEVEYTPEEKHETMIDLTYESEVEVLGIVPVRDLTDADRREIHALADAEYDRLVDQYNEMF